MERDPFRFAWRIAPGLNAALIAIVVAVGVPGLWIALDLVRVAIDALGPARAGGETRILRYAITLPDRVRAGPLVLFPGLPIARADLAHAVALGLALAAGALALVAAAASAIAARIGRDLSRAAVTRLIEGVASAPGSVADEARQMAALAGDALGHERDALGRIGAAPTVVGAGLALAVAYVAIRSVPMGLALLVGLCLYLAIAHRQMRRAAILAAADRAVGAALGRSLADLGQHAPAVLAHGTRGAERDRMAADFARLQAGSDRRRTRAAWATGAAVAAMLLGPLGLVAVAGWLARSGQPSPGSVASALLAACLALAILSGHLSWTRSTERLRALFADAARALGALQARRGTEPALDLPESGTLAAAGLSTGPAATGRLVGLDLAMDLPGHVALLGGRESGARTFAAVLGRQIAATAGHVTLAGIDIASAEAGSRARRLAFAGGETYLFPGSLRANLVYGSPDGADPALDGRLAAAIAVAGLDGLVERRGLSGTVDPRREPALAAAIVGARGAIAAGLAAQGLSGLVDPFDPARYNDHATIGENILFGIAVGDTFREERLPSQPFMKALLDREELTKPLAAIGASVARSTLEMFSDLPDEPSLLGGFALIRPAEREEFERILGRREAGRRNGLAGPDAEKLVGLALRYCETRHRLGVLSPDLEERLVQARSIFADTVPKSLGAAVEFFRPDQVCGAASLRDNLLFGRIAQEQAAAEPKVIATVRSALVAAGLVPDMVRIGLGTRVDPLDPDMSAGELAAVDLVRCLVREPSTLVVEHALEHLPEADATRLVERLQAALGGRGLLLVVPDPHARAVSGLFGRQVRFGAGRALGGGTTAGAATASPAETKSEAIPTRIDV